LRFLEWLIICSTGRFYNATAGTLKTNVTNVTLNDKSFNPTKEGTGCAASYTGSCDGSGGEVITLQEGFCRVSGYERERGTVS